MLFLFKLMEIEHHIGLAAKIAIKPFQCYADNVAVMNVPAAGYIAYLQPEFVNQMDVVFGQMRRMRTEADDVIFAARRDDPEDYAML